MKNFTPTTLLILLAIFFDNPTLQAQNAPVITSATTANVLENSSSVFTLTATDIDIPAQTLVFDIIGSETGPDVLAFGQTLGVNQSLTSPNGSYTLIMQSDGNLVIYGPGGHVPWASNTNGNAGATAVLQTDGNFVIYNGGTPIYATGTTTANESSLQLRLLNNGRLVIERASDGAQVWEATSGILTPPTSTYDNDKFELVSGNILQFKSAPNFEIPTDSNNDNVYIVRVKVTDDTGLSSEQDISITVTDSPETEFITVWRTTTANESITIPLSTGETYNYTVDWGDSTVQTYNTSASPTHSYATAGDYTVRIDGTFQRIFFNNGGDKLKLINVSQWGISAWNNFENAFYGCTNLNVSATDTPNLSGVTSLQRMFSGCGSLTGSSFFSSWNTGSVTNMNSMFSGATTFNQNLGGWDVSSLTSANDMFNGVTLSTINYDNLLNGWSTISTGETAIPQNITFSGGNSLYCFGESGRNTFINTPNNWTIIDGGRDTLCSSVTDFFVTTWRTTTANESITIPLSSETYNYIIDWGDGIVETYNTAVSPSHSYAVAGDHTVRITGVFPRIYFNNGGDKLKLIDVTQWGAIAWSSMVNAFNSCTNLNITALDTPNLSGVSSLGFMFLNCASLTGTSSFNSWNTQSVTAMNDMFSGATSFNQDIGNWNTQNVTSMTGLFQNAAAFNQDIGNWNTSNVGNMRSMFDNATSFNQDIGSWNTQSLGDMRFMFLRAEAFNQNIGNWNTQNATNMTATFLGATSFNQNIGNWNTQSVTNMSDMFSGATSFNQDLGNWDISSLQLVVRMFNGVTLSTANYDSLLNGWATLSTGETAIPQMIIFSGGNSQYCLGEPGRNTLVNTHSWTIIDDGLDLSCLPTTYTYNGSWLPSDPNGTSLTIDDIVIASGNAILSTNTSIDTVIVNPSASLTVNAGVTLTASVVTLESVSNSYSSLISDGTILGTINYQRFVNANSGGNDLVSAPLSGQTWTSFLATDTNNSDLLSNGTNPITYAFAPFYKTTSNYVNYTDATTTILASGTGYRAATSSGTTLTFTGNVPSSSVAVNILNTGTAFADWNLIGNPYPSYISILDFLNYETGLNVKNIDILKNLSGIYGYDGNAANGWDVITLANAGSRLMAPGQGFFVAADAAHVAAYDITFDNSMRATGTSDDFILGRNTNPLTYIKLNLTTVNNNYNTEFYFNTNASQGIDSGYDAQLWGGNIPSFALYSHLAQNNTGEPIALQALNTSDLADVTIPLGVNANQGEQLTFKISENTLPLGTEVYLEDNVTHTFTQLRSVDYIITPSEDLTGTGRFFLRFTNNALSTSQTDLNAIDIYVNLTNKTVVVAGQLLEPTNATIYNIQGQSVVSITLDITSRSQIIDLNTLSTGIYVVQLKGDTNIKTEKIIIN